MVSLVHRVLLFMVLAACFCAAVGLALSLYLWEDVLGGPK